VVQRVPDRPTRCAIYTRKSTDEGLDQAFNSLDAQREACAAYVMSQRHEGWVLVPEHYDDGGCSGGNMDRPGLQQLLADVNAGRIDVIVTYKVDRLTRSLADFACIVDVLDKRGTSFVSVTQSFNTTTSMGRLTLNFLLSFAQYERELGAERVRDKIAMSKAKGMWMGGPVPLGYDVRDRKLVANEDEAEVVRHIFQRYAELRSVGELADELQRDGVRTKARMYKSGRAVGGIAFTKGPLAYLLKNPVYVGVVRHKGTEHEGEHAPIIERALFDEVQRLLASARVERRVGSRAKSPSLLTGMLVDPAGRPMSPTFTSRDARRYRYYQTRSERGVRLAKDDIVRLPAGELERIVIEQLSQWLRTAEAPDGTAQDIVERQAENHHAARTLEQGSVAEQRAVLLALNLAVQVHDDHVAIEVDDGAERHAIRVEARLVDRGSDLRLAIAPDGGSPRRETDPVLIKLIVQAFAARESMRADTPCAMTDGYSQHHRTRLARLSYLAPDIVAAIIDGRQPPSLNGRRLLRAANLPLDWQAQRQMLGFA
jgi:site-specific DNA recombinase